jgi:NADPH:quinone reductase-like Zn-dependent oxidoreductase
MIEDVMPEPAAGQVRVKIQAAGVAYADVGVRLGTYPVPGADSGTLSPGYDIVGVVDKLGEQVSGWAVGQRVAALTVVGGYAEYLCVPAADLVSVPESVDAAAAVSLVLNYVTAYQMLYRTAEVKGGEWILVHGAAGGVGTALLQLGKLAGLHLIGTASARKQALVTQLGAESINYEAEDFVARVRALTGTGVHSAYDPIGGENIARSFDALRPGGILVTYGNYVGNQGGKVNPEAAAKTGQVRESLQQRAEVHKEDGKRLAGYFIGAYKAQHPDWFHADMKALFDLLAAGKVTPVIGARLPLHEAEQAHAMLDKAAISGKIVLIP